jgi:hypothetical protein
MNSDGFEPLTVEAEDERPLSKTELEREALWWVRVGLIFVGIPLLVFAVILVILYFTEGPGSENQPIPF